MSSIVSLEVNKIYKVLLDNNEIGTTRLEKADPSMGVVFGNIDFIGFSSGYNLLKDYCLKKGIDFTDYPEDNLISTLNIPYLKVLDVNGVEIKGLGNSISGMDSDGFEVTIIGVEYPFYEEEFPSSYRID